MNYLFNLLIYSVFLFYGFGVAGSLNCLICLDEGFIMAGGRLMLVYMFLTSLTYLVCFGI